MIISRGRKVRDKLWYVPLTVNDDIYERTRIHVINNNLGFDLRWVYAVKHLIIGAAVNDEMA